MLSQALKNKALMSLFLAGALLVPSSSAWARGAVVATDPAASALPAAPVPVAAAQESQSLETLKLEQPTLGKFGKLKLVEEMPSRRKWIALSVAVHGAAAFDAYTTRQAIGRGAVEADPMMRPFASSPAIYAAIQVVPVLMDFAARRMQRSHNAFVRRVWWLPQSSGAAMYFFSGVHNLGVAGRL